MKSLEAEENHVQAHRPKSLTLTTPDVFKCHFTTSQAPLLQFHES